MMVEDRAGRGSAGPAGRGLRDDGTRGADAGSGAGVLAVREPRRRSSISTSTAPRRSCSASTSPTCSPRCRSISARPMSTTSICSAAPSAWWRRPTSEYRIDTEDVLKHPRAQFNSGDTVPLGSFTTVRDISGPYRVPRYNLYPAAELDGAAAPGFRQGQAIADHGEARRGDAAGGLLLRVDDARLPADRAPATRRSSPSCWRWCSCSWCWPRSSRA